MLTDFGLAADDDRSAEAGTPGYTAPELLSAGNTPSPAADLWSLAATLYALAEGRGPFQREYSLATLAAVLTEQPPPPVNAGDLAPVLLAVLARDPAERPGARELRSSLTDAAGTAGLTASARPVDPDPVEPGPAEPGPVDPDATRAFTRNAAPAAPAATGVRTAATRRAGTSPPPRRSGPAVPGRRWRMVKIAGVVGLVLYVIVWKSGWLDVPKEWFHSASADRPCSLLSPQEVAGLIGAKDDAPDQPSPSSCEWRNVTLAAGGIKGLGSTLVQVRVWRNPDEKAAGATMALLRQQADADAGTATDVASTKVTTERSRPLTGVGSEAFYQDEGGTSDFGDHGRRTVWARSGTLVLMAEYQKMQVRTPTPEIRDGAVRAVRLMLANLA